ncbi:MAG: TetR/AcrR family transcriptional regulator [Paludibacter sp.]|nr:TetR/AcrR family transcriptional regulator [Paludibacter sp.]
MQNVNDIKVQIIEAAMRLFNENGIRRTSMDDLCSDLRISKKTFYLYFATKEQLIEEMMSFMMKEIDNEYKTMICGKNSIECMLMMIKKTYIINESHNSILQDDFEKYYPKLHNKFKGQFTKMFRRAFEQNLRQGIEEGYYRSELDVELLSSFQVFFTGSRAKFEMGLMKMFSRKRILDFFNDVFIRTVVNDAGMKYFEENYYAQK